MNSQKENNSRMQEGDISTDRVKKMSQSRLPTVYGEFIVMVYRDSLTGIDHSVLVYHSDFFSKNLFFEQTEDDLGVLVRLHSECLTGDVFGSQRCDCGPQLRLAMQMISQEKSGIVVYLRGHEGRGIGLANKISAYALQDEGYDTVTANEMLKLPVDARDYTVGVNILHSLNVSNVRLMTNNPRKISALQVAGLKNIKRVELKIKPNKDNRSYLHSKQVKMGHLYDLDLDL